MQATPQHSPFRPITPYSFSVLLSRTEIAARGALLPHFGASAGGVDLEGGRGGRRSFLIWSSASAVFWDVKWQEDGVDNFQAPGRTRNLLWWEDHSQPADNFQERAQRQ